MIREVEAGSRPVISVPRNWHGHRIRELRARLGWTQRELAQALGTAPAKVCAMERTNRPPSLHFCRLLDLLEANPHLFLEES